MRNYNACVRADINSDPKTHPTIQTRKKKKSKERKPNPYANDLIHSPTTLIWVLKDVGPLSHQLLIDNKYILRRELGRGEFGITYLCTDRESKEELTCKSISKRKLQTTMDIEDVGREVAIMSTLLDHPNMLKLKAIYEDYENIHLVMELCEGGELFDRIVVRWHYSERTAVNIARTIANLVRTCHENGVIHRDLKLENFLFANMIAERCEGCKENSRENKKGEKGAVEEQD